MCRNGRILLFTILALIIVIVGANNQCSDICGSIALTITARNRSCPAVGGSVNTTHRIDWSDGSFTDYSVRIVTQLVIGSCCSQISYWLYATGTVTGGRFSGQPITYLITLSDDRTKCKNGCETTTSGLTRVSGPIPLSIGTKGVGQWIECFGTYNILMSPGLTSNPQLITSVASADLYDCRTCVESC